MRIARATRIGLLCLATVALFGGAGIVGCNVGGDSNDNIQPTEPSPDVTPPQRGTLAITPTDYTLTIPEGASPGGLEKMFRVVGGRPPYTWSNASVDMGYLVPIDEFGQGYYTAAMYRFLYYPEMSGDDTILVRDGNGDAVTAKVTLSVEGAEAAPTPQPLTITANPTSIPAGGGDVALTASGGDGTYTWQTSNALTSFIGGNTGANVVLRGACSTSPYSTVVTVTSGGETDTEAISAAAALACP